MAETFMINQLVIKSKSMMKLERLQQEKEMITQLVVVDLSKQKELDADPGAIKQIGCYGKLETNSQVRTVLEKIKETILEFYKRTTKVL